MDDEIGVGFDFPDGIKYGTLILIDLFIRADMANQFGAFFYQRRGLCDKFEKAPT